MSHHNPELQPPVLPHPDQSIQPTAPDFVETPDFAPDISDKTPTPWWIYLICGFFLFLAGSSFTGFSYFGRGLYDQGPGGPSVATTQEAATNAPADPMALGKKVYSINCASCHQAGGEGQPGSYPPLVGSPWVLGHKERLAALLFKGVQGPIHVGGATYQNLIMPQQETVLSPEKIANLMTYIRGSWGNKANAATVEEVTAAKTKFASQTQPWTEAALLKIAPDGPDPTDKQ